MGFYDINKLYKMALIQGEGAGTAYEYYVKLRLLDKLFKNKNIKTALIYGLPEKYGYSLDFLYFCIKKDIKCSLYEKEKDKIRNLKKVVYKIKKSGIEEFKKSKITIIRNIDKKYDLVLSCEVIQNLDKEELLMYVENINNLSKKSLVLVPNKNNKYHKRLSGLKGYTLKELRILFNHNIKSGYIDTPPFPPGVRINKRIKSKLIIKVLGLFAEFERFIPNIIKRKHSHLCYILTNGKQN